MLFGDGVQIMILSFTGLDAILYSSLVTSVMKVLYCGNLLITLATLGM